VLHVLILLGRLLAEANTPLPDASDQAVLFIKRSGVVLDESCPSGDAGVDAGMPDGGLDAGPADAGVTDAGIADAGIPDAGGSCEPTDAITMVVQPTLGPIVGGSRVALLYVTPARPVVTTDTKDVFGELATVTAPQIEIERVEIQDRALGTQCASYGCSFGAPSSSYEPSPWTPPVLADAGLGDGGLTIETVGPYSIVRAQPADPQQLATWLTQLGYEYTQGDLDAVAPYIALGWHVVAVRVENPSPLGRRLTPLSFTWAGSEIRVPAALGAAPGATETSLTVYIAAERRYELPDAIVPFAMSTSYGNMGFLTRNEVLVDPTRPGFTDPIASAIACVGSYGCEYREIEVVEQRVYVPQIVACDEGIGCCNSRKRFRADLGMVAVAVAFVLRRPRRRGQRR